MTLLTLPTARNQVTPNTITEDCFCGYHRFCLEQPYHLDYASSNLCDLLGYTPDEIHTRFHDKYSQMVDEKDRLKFLHYIDDLASSEQTLTLQYHILCKDGHVLYLHDTMTSRRLEDGQMYGFSILADITGTPEDSAGDADAMPVPTAPPAQTFSSYGLLKFTCEKYPRITQSNPKMREYLGITPETSSWYDLAKQNVYFMIPFDGRDAFRASLDEARKSDDPIRIQCQLLCTNNSCISLTGWLSVLERNAHRKEFVLLCTPSTSVPAEVQPIQMNSYFHALENAYNVIFELNLQAQTIECIGGRSASQIGPLYDAHMTLESAKTFWLNNYVVDEDCSRTKLFFDQITSPGDWGDAQMYQAKFRLRWKDRKIRSLLGVAVRLDEHTVLLCCQDVRNVENRGPRLPVSVTPDIPSPKRIFARTFGHFDLFVDNVPITFSNEKEKELMALLIDRNGGTLSSTEAMGYLWEDEKLSDKLSARYRKLAMGLKNTLDRYGIGHILVNHHGVRSIDTTTLTCDYYEMLAGNDHFRNAFHNTYMTNYSWAEETLASLWDYS
jgi:PAS domain S-box-containing protein